MKKRHKNVSLSIIFDCQLDFGGRIIIIYVGDFDEKHLSVAFGGAFLDCQWGLGGNTFIIYVGDYDGNRWSVRRVGLLETSTGPSYPQIRQSDLLPDKQSPRRVNQLVSSQC